MSLIRRPSVSIDERFLQRWSPRAFRSDPVPREHLLAMFEAARWAPSCYNDQPWRFVWGQEPADHDRILGLLAEGNRVWAARAPVLGVVFARRRFRHDDRPNRWAPFDAGAAAISLSLQANELGYFTHFMAGFDAQRACVELGAPPDLYEAMAAFAIGRLGDPSTLPEELRAREAPSDRLPLEAIAFEGRLEEPGAAS